MLPVGVGHVFYVNSGMHPDMVPMMGVPDMEGNMPSF